MNVTVSFELLFIGKRFLFIIQEKWSEVESSQVNYRTSPHSQFSSFTLFNNCLLHSLEQESDDYAICMETIELASFLARENKQAVSLDMLSFLLGMREKIKRSSAVKIIVFLCLNGNRRRKHHSRKREILSLPYKSNVDEFHEQRSPFRKSINFNQSS